MTLGGDPVILSQPLNLNQIRFWREVADLYVANGQVIARKWPSSPKQPNTPAQIAARRTLVEAVQAVREADVSWHDTWDQCEVPPGRSITDLKRKIVMWNMTAGTWTTPPRVTSIWQRYTPDEQFVHVWITHAAGYSAEEAALIGWRGADPLIEGIEMRWERYSTRTCRAGYAMDNIRPRLRDWTIPLEIDYQPAVRRWHILLPGILGRRYFMLMQHTQNLPNR